MPNLLQADVACNQGPCPTKVAGCMKQKSDQLCVPAPILRFSCRQWQQANPRTGTRISLIVLVFKRGNNLVPQVCHSWNLKWLDCCQFHVFHVLHACHNLRREGSIQILIGVIFQATFVGLVLTATIDRARVCLFVCVCACVFCVWLCVQNIQWPTRRFTGNTPTWQGAREQKNVAQLHCLIRIATVEFVSIFFYNCKYEGKPHAKVVVTCPNFCSTEGFPWSILSNIQVSRLDHNIPTWWGDPWAPFHFM